MKKTLLLFFAFLCSMGMWANPGDEIKSPSNIVSGKSYYIKGVYGSGSTNNTIYYGPNDATKDTKISTDPVTDISKALPITFTKVSETEWTLTTPNGMYVYPHTSNGQSYLYKEEHKVTLTIAATKEGANKGFKFGTNNKYDFQCNKTAAKLGGYSSAQYGITLIEAEEESGKTATSLSFEQSSYKIGFGEVFSAPTLTATPSSILSSVTYSSTNTDVAEVNASTGAVTIKAIGETTIKATFAENEEYKGSTASYVLNVVDPNLFDVTFDLSTNKYGWEATSDGTVYFDGSTYTPAVEGAVTLSVAGNVRMWGTTDSSLRLYGSKVGTDPNSYEYGIGSITLTAAKGFKIKEITFEGSNLTFTPEEGTYKNPTWTGIADAVTLVKGSNTPQIKKITVTYEPQTFSLTTEDTEFYSLYLDYAVEIPEGMTAYAGKLNAEETSLALTEVENIIPAKTAVLLKGDEAKEYKFKATQTNATVSNNSLKGVVDQTNLSDLAVTGKQVLTLGMADGVVGFHQPKNSYVGANKAYLLVSAENQAKTISINFGDDITTGIQAIQNTVNSGIAYNLAGQRLATNTKGIVIINGKKYIK